jgi:hypothetical protein
MKTRGMLTGAVTAVVVAAIAAAAAIALGRMSTRAVGEAGGGPAANRTADFPEIILWAWERPEHLDFINPREVGVAYLARTLFLRGDSVVARPRLQPLSLPPDAFRMAVVRVESDRFHPATLSSNQRERAASLIADAGRLAGVAAVQVDFDARESERDFYRELLVDLRRRLPASVRLSMTALASWCMHDDWLSPLPVDEAVPMLFRMGADDHHVRLHLGAGGDFRPAASRLSLGVSTDEPIDNLPRGRRLYIFHPRAWTEQSARKILQEVKRWR